MTTAPSEPHVWLYRTRTAERGRLRPGLDGLRLRQANHADPWVVFGGRRRLITTSDIYDALFSRDDDLVDVDDLSEIARGPDLERGTTLVQADQGGAIFLLVGGFGPPIRHRIASWETFVDFGFRAEKVRSVPFLLLEAVARGEDVLSAASRASGER